ncbi:acyl transferase [Flammeovirga yaeyamensis]|uniref:Acyl transferase n=1 Tax=Flammeovirga yaeyamensis TaxID=367791 RepID=A0AAX1N2J3_9BACT|nr:acyl transferase [Flammeovirga yaeyamensis]MBB3701231.1 phenylacetate-coenzyme A ligase PaaK-like adenylate-forming protein [Flammeovirga yaeyamensis]NMF38443.1 acyl transferase [Flammeovirga yaeyamensis]QWG01696.1 acyl transferase [Flammeovirga yaeyamensis]
MQSIEFIEQFKKKIFTIKSEKDFEEATLAAFRFQAVQNPIYAEYLKHLGISINNIHKITEIPFMPIEFFKTQKVICENITEEQIFRSSGTTGSVKSQHYVADLNHYKKITTTYFEKIYGPLDKIHILALLPSYLERNDASLIRMVSDFMEFSTSDSDFYLDNLETLAHKLQDLKNSGEKVILFGVTFALLDFAEKHPADYSNVIIMETGGMKGRKKELTRSEVHDQLKKAFNSDKIHSEYGMTELLSQGYSLGDEQFITPPWMRIYFREINDPFSLTTNKRGGINIVDLGNIESCCFIETKDIGAPGKDFNHFYVLGRFDNTDIRGCNLMVQ